MMIHVVLDVFRVHEGIISGAEPPKSILIGRPSTLFCFLVGTKATKLRR